MPRPPAPSLLLPSPRPSSPVFAGAWLGTPLGLIAVTALTVVLAAACDETAPPPPRHDATALPDGRTDAADASPTSPPLRFGTTAEDLFVVRSMPHFAFTLAPDRWAFMQANASAEIFERATMAFEGAEVGEVGLRFKGSAGTLYGCFDEATRTITCPKLSLKVKFHEYEPERRFYGLKRLNLHAMVRDDSKVRERLSYDLFAQMGVIAPRHSWATVSVNGEDLGLYAMVEEIDGRFTDQRWPDRGNGNLYKGIWPVSERAADYDAALKTNEDLADPAKHDAIVQFATLLNRAPEGSRRAAATPFVDLDQVARYLAVTDAINGWDSALALLCRVNEPRCRNINYFWYQIEKRRYFVLVPWDMDQTWDSQTPLDFVPHWTTALTQCNPRRVHWSEAVTGALPPACDPLIAAVAEDLSTYRRVITELLEGPFSTESRTLERQLEWYQTFLEPYVEADPRGPGLDAFKADIAAIGQDLELHRERLRRLAMGDSIEVAGLENLGLTDFEEHGLYARRVGTRVSRNAESFASLLEDDGDALSGSRDLRLAFTLRTGATPHSHRASFTLRFRDGPANLEARTTLAFRAWSQDARTLRVALDSREYQAFGQTVRYGWHVEIGPTPRLVELRLADARPVSETSSTRPTLLEVRANVRGVLFQPRTNVSTASTGGYLPAEGDSGTVRIDDIRFY